MGEVQLEELEACSERTLRGGNVIRLHALDLVDGDLAWKLGKQATQRDRRRRDGLPTARIPFRDAVVSLPGSVRTGLSTGVRQLNARHGARGLDTGCHPGHNASLGVVPQSGVSRADTALGRDCRGFDNDKT